MYVFNKLAFQTSVMMFIVFISTVSVCIVLMLCVVYICFCTWFEGLCVQLYGSCILFSLQDCEMILNRFILVSAVNLDFS